MTSAPLRVDQTQRLNDSPATEPVTFMTVMDPPELFEHLFDSDGAAPYVPGTRALNAAPFTEYQSPAARTRWPRRRS